MNNIQGYVKPDIGKLGGGDALNNVEAIKRLPHIIGTEMTSVHNILVVSAIGATTRELNDVFRHYENCYKNNALMCLEEVLSKHEEICWELFSEQETTAIELIRKSTRCTADYIKANFPILDKKEQAHAKILSLGEVMSWHIVSEFLGRNGFENFKLDSREVVKTVGEKYTNAVVDVHTTFNRIAKEITKLGTIPKYIVCQGFLGSKASSNTTTLGYEGSDYSASVYAACFGGYLKFFKKFAYHDKDPTFFSNAKLVESVTVDELSMDVHNPNKKPILHPMTLNVMKKYGISGEIISYGNPNQRTRVAF